MKKREILIRAEEETDPRYGKSPSERSVEELIKTGVINLDKPVGPSSHEVTAWIKRILSVKKIAHAGTLEPPSWEVGVSQSLRYPADNPEQGRKTDTSAT